jgi:hypothetical protein
VHGDNFARFLDFVEEHDPDGKFANGFTRRLLGSISSLESSGEIWLQERET